jgi:predicted GH43/DUF377 family glycosyl hydrolase
LISWQRFYHGAADTVTGMAFVQIVDLVIFIKDNAEA